MLRSLYSSAFTKALSDVKLTLTKDSYDNHEMLYDIETFKIDFACFDMFIDVTTWLQLLQSPEIPPESGIVTMINNVARIVKSVTSYR